VVAAVVPAVLRDVRRQEGAREAPEQFRPARAAMDRNRDAGHVAVALAHFGPDFHGQVAGCLGDITGRGEGTQQRAAQDAGDPLGCQTLSGLQRLPLAQRREIPVRREDARRRLT